MWCSFDAKMLWNLSFKVMINNVIAFGIFCSFVMNLVKNSAFLKIWNFLNLIVELARDWTVMFVGPHWYIC